MTTMTTPPALRCPRCRGRLLRDDELTCIVCGWRENVPERELADDVAREFDHGGRRRPRLAGRRA